MCEFWVSLIHLNGEPTPEEAAALEANCTHVQDRWYIYEGDVSYLDADFTEVDQGAVESLGGLTQQQLVAICADTFGVDVTKPYTGEQCLS